MRCLYCGKQLPLLKKLTGGGEFCSEAHRQKYQEEYNKLALSRLLQTQNADSDAPHRGELVLASRQHPALQAGRPPLRALEAPRSADSPLTGNWTPGANRTQRALPAPTPLPPTNLPLGNAGALDAAPLAPPSNFLQQPIARQPLFPPQAKQEAKPEPSFRYEQRPDPSQPRLDQSLPRLDHGRAGEAVKSDSVRPEPIANRANNKRDAFSFRPMEPFPEQKPKLEPLPPAPVAEQISVQQAVEKAPRALPAPTPIPLAAKAPPLGKAKDPGDSTPPEGSFIIEEVRRPQPPPVPKLEMLGMEVFTKGHPPKPDGWAPWIAEVQGPPGELEQPDQLFRLTGPPGMASPGETVNIVSEQQESEPERQEIRKKILENQVKPGDFKQMVPTAPTGPNTVLPICPPAPALEQMPVVTKAKAPSPDPSLYTAPASTGEELWTGWSLTGAARIRESLGLIAPEPVKVPEIVPATDAPARLVAPAEPAKAATVAPALPKPSNMPVVAKPPTVEAPRNYKAAEALKSAAQNVTIVESAPKVEVRQPDKPSTPRHEVFVDLSVLGIEEDEDADAELLAREGESPPGEGGPKRRRRNSNARDAIRELLKAPHAPAIPVEPQLAQGFQTLAWKQPDPQAPRLSTPPLRPKIFIEPVPAPQALETLELKQQGEPVATAPAVALADDLGNLPQPTARKEEPAPAKQPSSLAAAWSAKRLKKSDPGTPVTTPADSGKAKPSVETPVETPVSRILVAEPVSNEAPETSATVAATTPLSETAKIQSAPANPATSVDPPISAEIQTLPELEPPAWLDSEPVLVVTPTVEAKITEPPKVEPPPAAPAKRPNRPKVDMSAPPLTPPRPQRADPKPDPKVDPNKDVVPSPVSGESRTVQKAVERAKALEAQKNEAQKSGSPKTADVPAAKKEDRGATTANAAKLPTPERLPQKPPFDAPLLDSGGTQSGSFWANLPVLPKIALALGLTAAIGGGAWFTLYPKGSSTSTVQQAKKPHGPARAGRSLMMNLPGGWSPDFGGDFNRKKNRTISLYRPSISNDDYRMEFEGQVDSRALGWVVRATDAKNYYGYKIELIRTGADPGAALARFAVVNGDESQKHYTPLLKPIRPGASFRVRLDVLGDEFSTYINDELVEVWQEDRLAKGGFGVMTELGEIGQIRKLQVFELLP